ncbi:transposon Tf2-1 polyprotein isoform X1 [Cucumis melo var. makuwa]|uniref:Transposon Tf2-1 polyprotein isoform X1 n=1 Tax=Cucumis melo var. makuwa TaxID=1194695 RepID=A0A5A7VJA6_CUCMM|nr:transposon Tf2-1 polyprotein isoform X1 [Cucumis melo var. makuwa]TYK10866.1 transposon Tf2-1 polyprotein isoform X1 [Cucumis melo var. makuwa]
MLVRFRATREGTLVGRFLTIKQETTVEEYRNRFDKLLAPVASLPTVVLEETFMNGLNPWLKSEVETLEPNGLAQMMKLALKIENKELVRKECGLISASIFKPAIKISRLRTPVQHPRRRDRPGKLANDNDNSERGSHGR